MSIGPPMTAPGAAGVEGRPAPVGAGRQSRRLFASIVFDVHSSESSRISAFRRAPSSFRRATLSLCPADVKGASYELAAAPLLLALYEPDIAQNAGAMMRTCACLGVERGDHRAGGLSHRRPPISARRDGLSRRACRSHVHECLEKVRSLARRRRTPPRAPDDEGETNLVGLCLSPRATSSSSAANRRAFRPTSPTRPMPGCAFPFAPPLRSLNVGVAATIALTEALRQMGRLPARQSAGSKTRALLTPERDNHAWLAIARQRWGGGGTDERRGAGAGPDCRRSSAGGRRAARGGARGDARRRNNSRPRFRQHGRGARSLPGHRPRAARPDDAGRARFLGPFVSAFGAARRPRSSSSLATRTAR